MFTVFAIICSTIALVLVPHGGWRKHTTISNIGSFFGVVAFILWCVVVIALIQRTMLWLWVHAP